jgi:hypothetical protein
MLTALDKELEQIEAQIQAQLSGRIRDFRLGQRDNGLVLQGRVHSYYAKQLAQHLVMEATVAPILSNEIVVA